MKYVQKAFVVSQSSLVAPAICPADHSQTLLTDLLYKTHGKRKLSADLYKLVLQKTHKISEP